MGQLDQSRIMLPFSGMGNDLEDLAVNYPEPLPNRPFAANMDLEVGFTDSYGSMPRFGGYQLGGDASSMYREASGYGFNNSRSSPGAYPEDGDMRLPSCNLSTASATSSSPGSPVSHQDQIGQVPEWNAPQGLGVTPGIVGQHDFGFPASNEYPFAAPQAEEFTPFEFPQPKAPGYVGELPQVSTLSSLSSRASLRHRHGSAMSSVSGASSQSTIVPEHALAVSTLLTPRTPALSSSPFSPVSSRKSSTAFLSPATPVSTNFSSPPPPAWPTSCAEEQLAPAGRIISSFFSQSSGHFMPPLSSSCWSFSFLSIWTRPPTGTSAVFADSFVSKTDPTLIHPDMARQVNLTPFDASYAPQHPAYHPGSPALTGSPLRNGSTSPYLHNAYQPYSPFAAPMDPQGRRPSVVSFHSTYSGEQQYSGDEKEKTRCPDCGRVFKDLKAHTLTHQTERPGMIKGPSWTSSPGVRR
jgi:hypothetical protein